MTFGNSLSVALYVAVALKKCRMSEATQREKLSTRDFVWLSFIVFAFMFGLAVKLIFEANQVVL